MRITWLLVALLALAIAWMWFNPDHRKDVNVLPVPPQPGGD